MNKLIATVFFVIIGFFVGGCQSPLIRIEQGPSVMKIHTMGQVITSGIPDRDGVTVWNQYKGPNVNTLFSMKVEMVMVSLTRQGRRDPLMGTLPKFVYRAYNVQMVPAGKSAEFVEIPAIPLEGEQLVVKVTFYDGYNFNRGEAKRVYNPHSGPYGTFQVEWAPTIGEGAQIPFPY